MFLARGGYERVEEEWAPNPADGDDEDQGGDGAQPLVLVKRKVTYAEPDRGANQYLVDRVLGRPRQSVEVSDADAGGLPRRIVIPDVDDRPEPDAVDVVAKGPQAP